MVMVMVMNDLLPPPLCNVNQPAHSEIQLFQNLTMKIHGQGHVCGQRSRSRLTLKNQRSRLWSRSNPLVTFEAWNSINMFAFCFVAIGPFLAEIKQIQYLTLKIKGQGHRDSPTVWCLCAFFAVLSQCYVPFYVKNRKLDNFICLLEFECAKRLKAGYPWGHGQGQNQWSYLNPRVHSICLLFVSWQSDHFWLRNSKFYIWPWKFKVKVMAKFKTDGHIWAIKFNRYVCFSFRGNQTIFGWDIANSIFDLENARSKSWPRSNLMVTFEP